MSINVLLSGRLKLDGYGRGKPENGDGTFPLTLRENSTVREFTQGMGVSLDRVTMTMINDRRYQVEASLKSGHKEELTCLCQS
jgi:hypothetical protein